MIFTRELINSFSTLIFDLDGTLLDSMRVWGDVDEVFLGKRGLKASEEYVKGVKGKSIYEGALFTIDFCGLNERPEDIVHEWESMVEAKYRDEILLKPGVSDFIKYAHANGSKICCATASSLQNTKAALKRNGVLEYFDCIISLNDFEVGVSKHEPDIFLKAMSMVGECCPDKCLVFEDVFGAIEGAKKGLFKTVIVYDELSSKDYNKAIDVADYYVEDWRNV